MRSLANRLALIFFLITLGAMAIVYVGVVPNLRSSLVERSQRPARPRRAPHDARRSREAIDSNAPVAELDRRRAPGRRRDERPRDAARRSTAAASAPQPFVKSDSNANADIRDLEFPAVAAAVQSGPLDARDRVRARRAHRRGRAAAVLPRPGDRARGCSARSPSTPRRSRTSQANVELVRNRILIAGLLALAAAVLAGYLVAAGLGPARRAAGERRAAREHRRLLRALPGRPRRRARPARGRARRDAAPARRARHGAPRLHRDRLARAAHPDLLARRLPRAARGRGPRRGDARRASWPSCACRSTGSGSSRPTCWTSPGWRPGRSSCARRRRTSSGSPRPSRRSSCPRSRRTSPSCELRLGDGAAGARLRPRARRAGAADPARQRARPHDRRHGRRARGAPRGRRRVRLAVTDRGTGHPARRAAPRLRAVLHLGRAPRVGARASRSRASCRSAWAASSRAESVPGPHDVRARAARAEPAVRAAATAPGSLRRVLQPVHVGAQVARRLHAPRRPRPDRGDPRARRAAAGPARLHVSRDRVRRRRLGDPLHARAADARRRPRRRLARDLRPRGVLQRDEADAQRAPGRPAGPDRRAVGDLVRRTTS